MTTDTMAKALRVLGYKNPSNAGDITGTWHHYTSSTESSAISTDLASLLRRCQERDLQPSVDTIIVNGQPFFMATVWPTILPRTGTDADPTEALILALAAMHDAKEKP